MSSEIVIRVQNLSKCYQIYDKPHDRLKQSIYPRLQRLVGVEVKQYHREFWALKDVSFEVKKGETVGIIGQNGSGKSTLLQLICGTLNLTNGSIETHGRIAALLELGSGFNPEFTGRENVYMNAAVLGLRKNEIDDRYDDILGFADIGNFIDQPVKTYSSGMVVRLAFAVQAQVDPAILIIDEALAVGDAKFQTRCFDRLKQLKNNGTSILLVTHSSEQLVTHCSYALLLNRGSVLKEGEPKSVVNRYLDLVFGKKRKAPSLTSPLAANTSTASTEYNRFPLNYSDDVFATHPGYNPYEYRWGDATASILDFCLLADNESYPSSVATGQLITLCVAIKFLAPLVRPIFSITIKSKEGITIYGVNSENLEIEEFKWLGQPGTVAIAKAVFRCQLAPGDYFISLGIATKKGVEVTPHDRRYDAIHFHVSTVTKFFGIVDLDLKLSAHEVTS